MASPRAADPRRGRLHPPGQPAVAQTLAQFVCGFHDLDLRDATGLGHGALLRRAPEPTRTRWLTRLAAGHLVGIAATERHGGSRIQEITTRAVPVGPHRWAITGEKVWVSRLAEASGIVVFFRDPTPTCPPRSSTRAVLACTAKRSHPPGWPAGPGVYCTFTT